MTPGERTRSEGRPRVSPADIVFIVVVFLLVCTTFAISEGLGLGAGGSGRVLETAAGGNVLRVTGFSGGSVEINGRRVDLGSVRSVVQSAAPGNRLIVVVEYGPGADPGLVADLLDTLKAVRVARISVKETRR